MRAAGHLLLSAGFECWPEPSCSLHHVQSHALRQNKRPPLPAHSKSRRSFNLIIAFQMLAQSCSYGLGLHASCTTCSYMVSITTEGLQDQHIMRAASHLLLSSGSKCWPEPSCSLHHVWSHALSQTKRPPLPAHSKSRRLFTLVITFQMTAQSCSYGLGLHASCTTCSLIFSIATEGVHDRHTMRAAGHSLLSSRSSIGSELQLWPEPACTAAPHPSSCSAFSHQVSHVALISVDGLGRGQI